MKEVELQNNVKFRYYTPKELKAHLDEYIIGQDEAKKILSVAVYNHYKRILLSHVDPDAIVEKSNIIMAGPTGCGKSAMIRCIADYMGVPCYIADATTITQAGYVGDDVESIVVGLMRKCGWSVSAAQYGIVSIDEIDKLAKRGSNQHISRDVVGEEKATNGFQKTEGQTADGGQCEDRGRSVVIPLAQFHAYEHAGSSR